MFSRSIQVLPSSNVVKLVSLLLFGCQQTDPRDTADVTPCTRLSFEARFEINLVFLERFVGASRL